MTRAEIRIAAARRRARAAEAALFNERERKRAKIEALNLRAQPRIWAAERKARDARQAVAVAELAALGITPMKTIILWHPKGYTAPSAQNRYAVRVTREGWKRLVPVGKSGAVLSNRNEQTAPYRWDEVTVTNDEVKG